MSHKGIISRILDSVDTAAEATVTATESKVGLVLKLAIIAIAAIVLLVMFALDSTLTVILVGLALIAYWLLDPDIGSSDGGGGARR